MDSMNDIGEQGRHRNDLQLRMAPFGWDRNRICDDQFFDAVIGLEIFQSIGKQNCFDVLHLVLT